MPYLTLAEWKERTNFEPSEIDEFLSRPGRANAFTAWLEEAESTIDDTLRRRYAVPFASPVPRAVKKWCRFLLDEQFELARRLPGSTEAQDAGVYAQAERARQEMQSAANANEPAHPELPLAANKPSSSGVALGGPVVVSYQMPGNYYDYQARNRP
jgi:hypothetical protein